LVFLTRQKALSIQSIIQFNNSIVYRTRSEILLERHTDILEVPPGTPALIQGATYYNLQERPILTGSMIFLADRIEIRYEYRKQDNAWSKQHVFKSP
jgi:hypothetical protein